MNITARADYAVRAMTELASRDVRVIATRELAEAQAIPAKFLEAILADLKRDGLVAAVRGPAGGFTLARPAAEITLADIIRAVDGPLASVQGIAPERTEYPGPASELRTVWVAVRSALRQVLESVTVAQLVSGELPPHIAELLADEAAWARR